MIKMKDEKRSSSKAESVCSKQAASVLVVNSREDIAKLLKEITKWYKKFDRISIDLFIIEAVIKSMEADDFETSAESLKAIAAKINKIFGVSTATGNNEARQTENKTVAGAQKKHNNSAPVEKLMGMHSAI